ncbi:hypothetical protein GCM10009836_31540 [Pseudonocardia ailaonensis]|uniref:Uncharacterized protein n=1 Tax=Pseudonocardia ailaonensis TaxID=367279 RepID=A0ABN2N444_9PSEU
MRLGRKLAEGVAVDREAERLAETREPHEKTVDAPPVVIAAETPVEKPARV